MGANLCLKNINDKHSPTKGINVIITDKITIKAKEIAQCIIAKFICTDCKIQMCIFS